MVLKEQRLQVGIGVLHRHQTIQGFETFQRSLQLRVFAEQGLSVRPLAGLEFRKIIV